MLPQRGTVFVIILEKVRKIFHKVRDNSVGTDPKEDSHANYIEHAHFKQLGKDILQNVLDGIYHTLLVTCYIMLLTFERKSSTSSHVSGQKLQNEPS